MYVYKQISKASVFQANMLCFQLYLKFITNNMYKIYVSDLHIYIHNHGMNITVSCWKRNKIYKAPSDNKWGARFIVIATVCHFCKCPTAFIYKQTH